MTSASATLFDQASPKPLPHARRSAAWLEFLLVGGATLPLIPLAWLFRHTVGLDTSELVVGFLTFHAAALVNDPHFSVTYLLFYKDARRRALGDVFGPAQRARYWVAGVVVPVALGAWAVSAIATRSAQSLGLMMQLMFFLVGWHYVKQGFGVLSVLSARRGVRFTQLERRALLGHCISGWLYARASPADPGTEYIEHGVIFTSLPHPPGLQWLTGAVFAASTALLAWAMLARRRRERRLPPAAASIGFLVTVWLWVVYSSIDPLIVYLIPALHSVQYLYFVWLLRRNEARAHEGPPHFKGTVPVRLGVLALSAVALGWLLLHGAPGFLDEAFAPSGADDALGATPYLAAFVTLVNIHHYFMDTVIWRRENPDTRFLRDPDQAGAA